MRIRPLPGLPLALALLAGCSTSGDFDQEGVAQAVEDGTLLPSPIVEVPPTVIRGAIAGTWEGIPFTLEQASATLAFANRASADVLDHTPIFPDRSNLDTRSVAELIAARPIDSLDELAAIRGFSGRTLGAFRDLAVHWYGEQPSSATVRLLVSRPFEVSVEPLGTEQPVVELAVTPAPGAPPLPTVAGPRAKVQVPASGAPQEVTIAVRNLGADPLRAVLMLRTPDPIGCGGATGQQAPPAGPEPTGDY